MKLSLQTISAALITGKGCVRGNNEDAYYFNGEYAPLEKMSRETTLTDSFEADCLLFAICDGMGGYENGEVASFTAVSRMKQLQKELSRAEFSKSVSEWVEETNRAIRTDAEAGGCTLAMVCIDCGIVRIASIGDSRVYRYHQGQLTQMTKDHSKVQILIDAGMITPEEAATHPQRHVITRFLGMDEREGGRCVAALCDPVPAKTGDRYMICSDGVTDMLSEEKIQRALEQEVTTEKAARLIYESALKEGGRDNTSVIILDVKETKEPYKSSLEDTMESTFTPQTDELTGRNNSGIQLEQILTIDQPDGQKLTIKSMIIGKQAYYGTL